MATRKEDSTEIRELQSRITDLEDELEEVQQALIKAQFDHALFQSLIDSLPQNIFSKDLDGRITFANQQYCILEDKILSEIIGKTDFDLHPHDLAIKYRADDQHVISTQQVITLEEEHQPITGERSVVKVIKAPLYAARGDVIGTIGVFWDITNEKNSEQERLTIAFEKERIRILSHFIEGALHEFRTPLSTIRVHLYMLSQALGAEHGEHLQIIERQTDDILGLVESLSTISKLDNNENLRTQNVNINQLIQDIYTKKHTRFDECEIHASLALKADLPSISASSHELSLAIESILDNAIKHTPAHENIKTSTHFTEDHVIIIIEDTGIGIEESILPRIFERFFRQDSARTTRGFGLGLPTAKSIVERHQGEIQVESIVGQGSTFTILLPRMIEHPEHNSDEAL